jgi:hypothetical protein
MSDTQAAESGAAKVEAAPPDTHEMLRRILHAVEGTQRKRWVEITCAVVLALATMASAWCAYQSTLWGGVQTFKLAAAAKAGREAAKLEVEGIDARMFDKLFFMHWVEHRGAGNRQLEQFLAARFRPTMKVAVDAWLATDPFNNPQAPLSPLLMPEYVPPELVEIKRLQDESATMFEAANESNHLSDTYVLLTVLFATVLFFGGISGTISNDSRRLRWTMQILSLVLFVAVSTYLLTMPLCRE